MTAFSASLSGTGVRQASIILHEFVNKLFRFRRRKGDYYGHVIVRILLYQFAIRVMIAERHGASEYLSFETKRQFSHIHLEAIIPV